MYLMDVSLVRYEDSVRDLRVVRSLSGHHDCGCCSILHCFEVVTLVKAAVDEDSAKATASVRSYQGRAGSLENIY